MTGKVDIAHVHQLMRLLMETQEIPGTGPGREHHLVSGLVRVVGAAGTSMILDPEGASSGDRQHAEIVLVGWDRHARRSLELLTHASAILDPIIRAMARITPHRPGAAVTSTWPALAADLRNLGAKDLVPRRPDGRLAHALFSTVRLRALPHVHGLGLYREAEAAPFSDEERDLVHVFHAACESVLSASQRDACEDDQPRSGLSRRMRQTLDLVLGGLADKEIAERLGISRHTVNQYTKALYRHYAVTSRAQLLARLLVQPPSTHSLITGN